MRKQAGRLIVIRYLSMLCGCTHPCEAEDNQMYPGTLRYSWKYTLLSKPVKWSYHGLIIRVPASNMKTSFVSFYIYLRFVLQL